MPKRSRRMMFLACGLVACGLAWVLFVKRVREPSYQGRTLSEWYVQWANSADNDNDPQLAKQCAEAADAIRQIGTNALPMLLDQLKQRATPSPARATMWRLVSRLPRAISENRIIASVFLDTDKFESTSTFVILGPQAAPAIPELTGFLVATNTPSLIHSSTYCLAAIGDEGLPPLLAALADPQHPARYEVAYWLGLDAPFHFGTNISQAVPLLAQCATGNDQLLAEAAAKALGRIHQSPQVAIPALVSCLTATNSLVQVRFQAAKSLASFGSAAVPHWEIALTHSDETVRRFVTNFLQLIAEEVLTNAPPQ